MKKLVLIEVLERLEKSIDKKWYITKDQWHEIRDSLSDKILFIWSSVKFKNESRWLSVVAENSYYNTIDVSDQWPWWIQIVKRYKHEDVEFVYWKDVDLMRILYLLSLRKQKEIEKYSNFEEAEKNYNEVYVEIIRRFQEQWRLDSKLYSVISVFDTWNEDLFEEFVMFIDELKLKDFVPKHYAAKNKDKNDWLLDTEILNKR